MMTILILAGVTAGFAVDSDGAISEGEYDNQLSLSGGEFILHWAVRAPSPG